MNPSMHVPIDVGQPEDPEELLQTENHFVHDVIVGARRNVVVIVACAIAGLGYATYLNLVTPKVYTASSTVQIIHDSASQFRIQPAAAGGLFDEDSAKIETEIQILRSAPLALATIKSLGLQDSYSFLPHPPQHPWDVNNVSDRHALVGSFESNLSALRSGHTSIMTISFKSTDPGLAAAVCNRLIEKYTERNFQDNYESTEQVSRWLQAQLGGLKERLSKRQEHLLSLQKDIGVVGLDVKDNVVVSRLDALNQSVTKAETERLIAQGRLVAVRSAQPSVLDTLGTSAVLPQLLQRKASLSQDYAVAASKYGVENPVIQVLNRQLSETEKAIATEEATIIHRGEEEVDVAERSERSLSKALQDEKDKVYATDSKAVELALASKEYDADRTLYQELQSRLEEAGILAGLHSSTIRVIEPAESPDGPSSPRKTFNRFLYSLAGLLVGVLMAMLREISDTSVKTSLDVEERIGLSVLGMVPKVSKDLLETKTFIDAAKAGTSREWSPLIEALRALRSSLLLSRAVTPPKVILITSSQPAEGKSSIASLLGIVLSLTGSRVLLIDADLRRPVQKERFGLAGTSGLSSVLAGTSEASDVIRSTSVPSLFVMPAGPTPPMPAELLGSSQMHELVESLRESYAFILIDTPPLLSVTDAAVLVAASDGVVLVVRSGNAPRRAIIRTASILVRSRARVLGVVLNGANPKSSEDGYYYAHSKDPYHSREGDRSL